MSSSSSSSSRECPWQWKWKRPQWQSLFEETNPTTSGGGEAPEESSGSPEHARDHWKVLSSTSAQVLRDEIPDGILPVQAMEAGGGSSALSSSSLSSGEESIFWVTVTVVSSSTSTANHSTTTSPHVIHVLVELFQQPNQRGGGEDPGGSTSSSSIQKLCSRQLQWPESALVSLDVEEEQKQKPPPKQPVPEVDGNDDQENEQASTDQVKPLPQPNDFWMFFTGDSLFHRRRPKDAKGNSAASNRTTAAAVGLTAVALCRSPPPTTQLDATTTTTTTTTVGASTDALDAISFLSFGLVPAAATTSTSSATPGIRLSGRSASEALESIDENFPGESLPTTTRNHPPPPPTDLLLACLTTSGKIHVYSLWKLLHVKKTSTERSSDDSDSDGDDDAFTKGWLELWLGVPMHEHLQQTIRPLSHPMVTVSLTTVSFQQEQVHHVDDVARRTSKTITEEPEQHVALEDHVVDKDNALNEQDHDNGDDDDDDMAGNLPPLWDETVWDSSVDPSTAMYRTFDNVPTLLVPAFQYLAIAGRGFRNVRRQRAPKQQQQRRPQEKTHHRGGSSSTSSIQPVPTPWHDEPMVEQQAASSDASLASSSAASVVAAAVSPSSTHQRPQAHRKERKHVAVGGFVTLVSLNHYSEMRTLFLPFVPERVSPIVWGDMTFLLVIPAKRRHHYPYHPVAIRIDSQPNDGVISCGQIPFLVSNNTNTNMAGLTSSESSQQQRGRLSNEPEQQYCSIPRFKLLPVLLPREESSGALVLVGSSPFTFPPALAVLQERKHPGIESDDELLVTLHTFENIDIIPKQLVDGYLRTSQDSVIPAIVTQHPSSHLARIPFVPSLGGSRWCSLGQGWCLVGKQGSVYFVSWEGATSSHGAFVKQVGSYDATATHPPPGWILPLFPNTYKKQVLPVNLVSDSARLSDRQAKSLLAAATTTERETAVDDDETLGDKETEEILVEALESISGLTYRDSSSSSSLSASRRRSSFSHRERSAVLLRHCSSWTQLDDASHNRSHVSNQVPILSVRSGASPTDCFVLSLRRIVVESGDSAPFNDVLSWMSQQEDFFTAASVALALLRDAETLRHLWRATEHIEADEEMSRLEGLLDGIVPLNNDLSNALKNERQLADMTVGCLVKGGFAMSSTLELFVSHDVHYDPSRACLMLVAATACAVSSDEETMKSAMGRNYTPNDQHEENILWPVRCLLQLGVARGYLAKALILLNATVPDEIRRRRPSGNVAAPAPSMKLCTSLVSLVVGAAPGAAELLLGLVDQQSRSRFWQSLDHETKLALALVSISGKSPMLRQAEVRAWARLHLNDCIKDEMSASGVNVYEVMPTEWLRKLCMACLRNAGCDLTFLQEASLDDAHVDESNDIEHHAYVLRMTRNALMGSRRSGGLDFDLVIPALLLLSHRGSQVQDDFQVSTQSVLDAACYLAGRPGVEESVFGFDGATVMRLCATSGNVSAGANLIGGRDGLVLKCCDILMHEVGMTMDDAEGFLVNDDVNLQTVDHIIQFQSIRFVLNEGHRQLLRLLDEYVLKVRTYGDFQTENARGKVDPIFASRCFFRSWLCLTTPDTAAGSLWLVTWLRRRLGMEQEAISGRRLACSAILRALVWPATNKPGMVDLNSPQHLLATALDVESKFLVQLAQACCGLVESLPPWVAEDVLRSFESSGQANSSQLTLEV